MIGQSYTLWAAPYFDHTKPNPDWVNNWWWRSASNDTPSGLKADTNE